MNHAQKRLAAVTVLFLLCGSGCRMAAPVVDAKIDRKLATVGLTTNEIAAHGPLPGDVGLYAKELACSQALPTPGYYSSLNAAEISDSERSGLFPCATFLGSFDGPNQVFAWKSADSYPGISYINNRKPGELYLVGGEFPVLTDPLQAGPYVAKANATTGEQIWRTYLDNPHASGHWIGNANLNILENGRIVFAWSNQIVLLDPDTGEILKHNMLPAGEAPVEDVNYKHLTVAPDGTLILKDQTRPIGCTLQGTVAIIKCDAEGMKQPNSQLVAVDPDTLEIIDQIPLPEPATSPHIITTFEGRITIYIGMNQSAGRAFWDPKTRTLTLDESWVVHPMQKGQTAATAATMMGDWVAFQLNGIGSDTVASSVVVVNQKDSSRTKTIFPFGPLKKGEWSFCLPKNGADPENGMLYSADMGIGKVAGIRLDQATGDMEVVFVLDDMTTTFQPLLGPKDARVLLLTNMKRNVAHEPAKLALFTENYKEQLTWRNAATGALIAESDYFEPLTINSLMPPGFGGRVYFPTAAGEAFYVLQVMPRAEKPAATGQAGESGQKKK